MSLIYEGTANQQSSPHPQTAQWLPHGSRQARNVRLLSKEGVWLFQSQAHSCGAMRHSTAAANSSRPSWHAAAWDPAFWPTWGSLPLRPTKVLPECLWSEVLIHLKRA